MHSICVGDNHACTANWLRGRMQRRTAVLEGCLQCRGSAGDQCPRHGAAADAGPVRGPSPDPSAGRARRPPGRKPQRCASWAAAGPRGVCLRSDRRRALRRLARRLGLGLALSLSACVPGWCTSVRIMWHCSVTTCFFLFAHSSSFARSRSQVPTV